MADNKKIADKEKWIILSKERGYEGAGAIMVYDDTYVLGINEYNEAEYFGGKIEESDASIQDTAQREILEETGLIIDKSRLNIKMMAPIEGGLTGTVAHVFLLNILKEEYDSLKSTDQTFIKFIRVKSIIKRDNVVDINDGKSYLLRKFNRKYIIPQLEKYLVDFI